MLSQNELAQQMIQQLRVLDPSVSCSVGTPERKILDTVAQALSDSQIDFSILGKALNLDTKVGSDLENFLALFGFARQQGTYSTGIIQFSRVTPSTVDLTIPRGTQIAASVDTTRDGFRPIFLTTSDAFLLTGETTAIAPIRSIQTGSVNNVPANTATALVGTSEIFGITAATNPSPTTGGQNTEQDEAFKIRFKNTVFRNLSGTEDQYLALSVSTSFSTKANVVGPISRYREYVQIPDRDDASAYEVNGVPPAETGNGAANEFTTALSTIPYSKHTYTTVPNFVSNGKQGIETLFYTEGIDFQVNTIPPRKNKGDAYRLAITGRGDDPITEDITRYQPNVTFYNVYEGEDDTIETLRPGDVVLFEHSYTSAASRNDDSRNVSNCVDVFIDGSNKVLATSVIPRPSAGANRFIDSPSGKLHFDNFRRVGEPEHRPILGNVFTPLFFSPIEDLPNTITTDDGTTYLKGVHYWALIDNTELNGTVRSRTGIEWNSFTKGIASESELVPSSFTGPTIVNPATGIDAISVDRYTYDRNIIDLQVALEGSKQITTDALAHKADIVYLKFDLTVMYNSGFTPSLVNQAISDSLDFFLKRQQFGATIQLSDILQAVHDTPGVDNVRWSNEIDQTLDRVIQTNTLGLPRAGGITEQTLVGVGVVKERQQFYITGEPEGGTYQIKHATNTSAPIPYNANAATIAGALVGFPFARTSGNGTPQAPYAVEFISGGPQGNLIEVIPDLMGGPQIHNTDFFLQDNELPALPTDTQDGDTLPGLIIRPRAQSTWARGGR